MPKLSKTVKVVANELGDTLIEGSKFAKNIFKYGNTIMEQQIAELKQEQSMNNEEWAKRLRRVQAKYETISNIVEDIEDIKEDIPQEIKDLLEAELKQAIASVKKEEPKPDEEPKPEEK
jgi:hypothetical protein